MALAHRRIRGPEVRHRAPCGERQITLWKDYWDTGALANFAPATWMEDFANADMSWIFDATGLV
jgi:hypothetical protein